MIHGVVGVFSVSVVVDTQSQPSLQVLDLLVVGQPGALGSDKT